MPQCLKLMRIICLQRWGKRAAHNRAQIVYYMAENLEVRREEIAEHISSMTGKSLDDSRSEVDLSVQRLFYWGAYCDKYGGTVQVDLITILTTFILWDHDIAQWGNYSIGV